MGARRRKQDGGQEGQARRGPGEIRRDESRAQQGPHAATPHTPPPASLTVDEHCVPHVHVIDESVVVDADRLRVAHPALDGEGVRVALLQDNGLRQIPTAHLRALHSHQHGERASHALHKPPHPPSRSCALLPGLAVHRIPHPPSRALLPGLAVQALAGGVADLGVQEDGQHGAVLGAARRGMLAVVLRARAR